MDAHKAVDWELQLAQVKANLPMVREYMALQRDNYAIYATQYRAYFDALVVAGFTPEQALEIVKAHGWIPK